VGSTVDPFDVPGPDSQAAAAGGCREHGTPQGGSLGATRRIEATASRVETTALLAELLRATPYEVMARVAYLTQGKLHPDFEGVEIGVAEKLAVRAVAEATGTSQERWQGVSPWAGTWARSPRRSARASGARRP